jgi:myo-inositol 2-dehydrogenase/D-chiro-inositol 1-dehydrogenase
VTDGVVELALVGAGRMGRMHLRALGPAGRVSITDVVEPAAAGREVLRDGRYRLHARLADLLAARRPDGVLVAAPTDRHTEIARTALAAGIPVLCEKPAGLAWREIEETGRLAEQRGVAFQVAYWRRFVPSMVALRERIGAGELGQVLHVVCAQWDGAPPPARFRRESGGAFLDMGVHEFDVIRWLTGQPVAAVVAVQTPALDAAAWPDADNAQALLRLADGATAAVSLGRHHPGRRPRDGRALRLRRALTPDRARPRRWRRADGGRARPAGGVVRRARPGWTPSWRGNGRCRCRTAGRRAGRRPQPSGRDRAVT